MPVDYEELLRDLETDEARLLTELSEIRAAKPLVERRRLAAAVIANSKLPFPFRGRFVGMGATKAIPMLLEGKTIAMTSREIMDELKAGGWTSNATDHLATVSATLSNLRDDVVIKVGEGWKLKPSNSSYLNGQLSELQEEHLNRIRDLSDEEIPDDVRRETAANLVPTAY